MGIGGRRIGRRELLQLGGVVAGASALGLVLRRNASLGTDVSTNLTARVLLRDRVAPHEGAAGADVVLVAFTDYQCGACRVAAPAMAAAARADGGVRIVYKDWPIFGPLSEDAALVALAADRQGIYPALHHSLMSEQRRLERDVLREQVRRVGGSWSRLERDLASDRSAIEEAIDQTRIEAMTLGLPGTPAFLIGGTLVIGALSRREFARAFAEARERKSR